MDLWVRELIQKGTDSKKADFFYNVTRSPLAIPNDEIEDFWVKYCDTVKVGTNPHISEMIGARESRQLGFELNLHFEKQQIPYNGSVITKLADSIDQYVEQVIGVTQFTLKQCFDLTDNQSENLACYLRRDDNSILLWKTDTVEYTGRLIFPYARIRNDHLNKFYHMILNHLQLNGHTPDKYLSTTPINGLDTFLRPRAGETSEMYGSSFSEGGSSLQLHRTYGLLNTSIKTVLQVSQVFSPTFHSAVTRGHITPMTLTQKTHEHGIEYWLPLLFSSDFYDTPMEPNEGIHMETLETPKLTMTVIKEKGESLSKVERARQLLGYISVKRMDEYWSWIDIGQALKTINPVEGLALWKWFTKQSDYKGDEDCDVYWNSFDGSEEVDVETLEYFASLDNPEGYEKYSEPIIRQAINKAVTEQEHTSIAKAFKACFPHTFLCSNFEAGMWFTYNGSRWVSMSGTSDLMWYINERFRPQLEKLQAETAINIAKSNDTEYKDRYQNFHNLTGQLIARLGNYGFKEQICKEMKIYYERKNFNQLKDRHPEYTATPTGVIDVRGGEVVWRKGKPQDYCHRCTRYDPLQNGSWNHPSVKITMHYLSQVYRNKEVRECMLRFVASLLRSGNADRQFPIFTGGGRNSKSAFVRLIEAALGNYAIKLPTTLFTGRSTGADVATPTVIHANGAKVAFLEEPNKDERMKSGEIKRWTGNDKMFGRDLFQKGAQIVEMTISIVPVMVANKIPVIPDCQQAVWDRVLVFLHDSQWDNNAPDDPDEQFRTGIFKLNRYFDRSINLMASAFLWIMMQIYPDYYNKGLRPPAPILEATLNFQTSNNYYIHFTRDCVKEVLNADGTSDQSAFVTLDDLHADLKKWWADQAFREKMPTKTEFKENLQIIWKAKADADNKWYGLKRLNAQNTHNTIASLLKF